MVSWWIHLAQATVIVGTLLYIYGCRPLSKWRLRHIPGPGPGWLVGNVLQMQKLGSPAAYHQWAKQYGPVFKVFLGSNPVVVVAHPELARKVLMHSNDRPTMPNILTGREYQLNKDSILLASGDKWKSLRAVWSPMFYSGSLEAYAHCMHTSTDCLIAKLGAAAKAEESVDMAAELRTLALSVVGTSAFGVDFTVEDRPSTAKGCEEEKGEEAAALCHEARLVMAVNNLFRVPPGLSKYMASVLFFPQLTSLIRWMAARFPERRSLPGRTAISEIMDESARLISEARGGGETEADMSCTGRRGVNPGCFIKAIMKATDRSTGGPFTDNAIISQAFIMIVAGFATTASAMVFAVYLLARNPDKLRKFLAEIDAAGKERPSYDDLLEKFPYTDAVVRETLRLMPPVPNLTGRILKEDMDLGGYTVPRGTWVSVAAWSIQHNSEYWEQPEAFIPERWIEGTAEAASRPAHAFYSFGDGPRSCVGSRFALEEAKIALVRIYQRFSLEVVKPAAGEELKVRSEVLMVPEGGVHVKVTRR